MNAVTQYTHQRSRTCGVAASLLVAVLGASLPSLATAETPQDTARELFREGNELMNKGDFGAALERYRKARALYPSYKIDLNIGTSLNSLGRHTEAAEHYEQFLAQAAKVAPEEIVKEVRSALDELRKKLARLKVSCPVAGATVELDGKAAGATPLARELYADPGSRRVVVSKQGYPRYEVTLDLAAGEVRPVTVVWPAAPLAPSPVTPPRLAPPERPTPLISQRPAEDGARRNKTIWAYTALGAGGAFVITAVALYGAGKSQGDSAHEQYKAASDPVEIEKYRGDVESAKKMLIGGHVMIGLGVVALGVSIYQFVTRPAAARRAERATAVGVAPTVGGAALTVDGRF